MSKIGEFAGFIAAGPCPVTFSPQRDCMAYRKFRGNRKAYAIHRAGVALDRLIATTTPEAKRLAARWAMEWLVVCRKPSPSSNNAIKGMHFHAYKKLRNGWRASVLAAIGGKVPAVPIARSALKIERYCAGSLDWDNAYGGLKPPLDCLVAPSVRNPDGLRPIQDDSPNSCPRHRR